MSNPAVITLANASNSKNKIKRFVIEDNIGESIHLHIDNMRIDFNIEEYLSFADLIRNSLKELDFLCGYKLDDFDEHFLKECSVFLPKLKSIMIEDIELSQMKCLVYSNIRHDLKLLKLEHISNTPAYKYLQGDKDEFLKYKQFNYFGIDNEKRLLEIVSSIKKNGYPFEDKHIVLFNSQNIVRDGQHRVAVLAHLHGLNSKIKIMRFNFMGNNHRFNMLKYNAKAITIWLARKVYRRVRRYI